MFYNLISHFKLNLSPMLINSTFIFFDVIQQLLFDLIMNLLHLCNKVFFSNASKFILLQIYQLWYFSWIHSIYYIEWTPSYTPIWCVIVCKTLLVTESDPTSYDFQWLDSSTNFLKYDLPPHYVHMLEGDMLKWRIATSPVSSKMSSKNDQ
jgi:hypothetical protein